MLNFLELVLDYLFVTIVVHLISLLNISDGELKLYKPAKLSTQLYVKKVYYSKHFKSELDEDLLWSKLGKALCHKIFINRSTHESPWSKNE